MKSTSFYYTAIIIITLLLMSCRNKQVNNRSWSSSDSARIINEILTHRSEVDSLFRYDPDSPFNRDSSAHFGGIKWFPPDVRYYFQSKLYRYETPETVTVLGTKGEERKHLKYGYFILKFNNTENKLNVYKFTPADKKRYEQFRDFLSVWFRDGTTGKETYSVGRYVDVGKENSDPGYIYTINLNNSYNPYCAYSSIYSCAIPREEDILDFPVRAGEMKYHQ